MMSGVDLAEFCYPLSVAMAYKEEVTKKQGNALFRMSGSSEITGYYGSGSILYPNASLGFVTMQARPVFYFGDIPLRLNMGYTTDKLTATYYNRVAVEFDAAEYRDILQNKLIETLTKELEGKLEGYNNIRGKVTELENLERWLNDTSITNSIGDIDSLKAIQEEIGGVNIDRLITKKDSLMALQGQYANGIHDSFGFMKTVANIEKLETFINAYYSKQAQVKELDRLLALQSKYNQIKEKATGLKDKVSALENDLDIQKLQNELDVLKDKIKNPNQLQSLLQQKGLLGKFDKYLLPIQQLKIGEVRPVYGQLTHWGMPVNGIQAGVKFNDFIASVTSGKTKQLPLSPFFALNTTLELPVSKILSGQVGWQQDEQNYLLFNFLISKNDNKDLALEVSPLSPIGHHVIGAGFGTALLKKLLAIKGEIALSLTGYDPNYVSINTYQPYNHLAKYVFGEKAANGISDMAYRFEINSNLLKDKLTIQYKYQNTGFNFYSPGVPFLISGHVKSDGRLGYKLFKGKINTSVFYAHELFEQDGLPGGLLYRKPM
jgi:hypothetical protein